MKSILDTALKKWNEIYITYKILFIIAMLTFGTIILSVFDNSLGESGNLVIIRTTFSSIIGFLLESSMKNKMICDGKVAEFRNWVVGIVSVIITIVIVMCYIIEIASSNASLILLKNVLFSCVGFLISACSSCGKD